MRLGVGSSVIGGELVDGDIEIEDGKLASVGVAVQRGRGIAVPGFIDLHTHGYAGIDFARATREEMAKVSMALTETGVTYFQPTLPTLATSDAMKAIEIHSSAEYPGARFGGDHLEGPFLSDVFPGAHPRDLLRDPELDLIKQLIGAGEVVQVTLAPELPGAMEAIDYLSGSGVVVSLGHSNADGSTTREALARGATAMTHVFNASRPLHHRDPGINGVMLADSEAFVTAVLDQTHLSPEVALIVARSGGARLVAITDAMAAAGLEDGTFTLGDKEVEVVGGRATLPDGTIASSVLTMDQALRNLVDLGLSLMEAVRATSISPARMARLEIPLHAVGSVADLVVLDEDDLSVIATFVGGKSVFTTR